MANVKLGFRQIHLDFHTSPHIPDVGSQFDPEVFADMVAAANVDSVTCFAKCHHGHLYFDTKHPARHPSLPKGMDLLRQQIDALHARGIRVPIYISVQCDEFAANTHPEWLVRNPNGTSGWAQPLQAGWQIVDMSSPYYDYLKEQTRQVLAEFSPVDGIFFDMCWNQPSVSNWAKEAMMARNLDPESETDRNAYAAGLAQRYMKELSALVRNHTPNAAVYFNSRPLSLLTDDLKWMTHVEIEALATGGWGYMYFPLNVRSVRMFGVPYLGMTARFHKTWADFGGLKSEAAMKYEICQMIAHGARCSIGDQLHPRGTLDAPAWERIGRVYGYAKSCQPWCENSTSLADVALVQSSDCGGGHMLAAGGTSEGAARMFMQLKAQFDVVDAAADLKKYRLAILPDNIGIDARLARRLDAFVKDGGKVLLSGASGLDAEGRPTWKAMPISKVEKSPFTVTYARPTKDAAAFLPDMNHVMYDPGLRVKPAAGATVLAKVVEPYFERNWRHFCSHGQTPPAKATRFCAAVVKGAVGYIAYPIFSMLGKHGSPAYRQLVQACLSVLVGRPMVETAAPTSAEVSVMRKGGATLVHVLYWPVERRAENLDLAEDIVPLIDVPVSIALSKKPAKAYLAPSREPLAFTWASGRASFVIPRVEGHRLVVLE